MSATRKCSFAIILFLTAMLLIGSVSVANAKETRGSMEEDDLFFDPFKLEYKSVPDRKLVEWITVAGKSGKIIYHSIWIPERSNIRSPFKPGR